MDQGESSLFEIKFKRLSGLGILLSVHKVFVGVKSRVLRRCRALAFQTACGEMKGIVDRVGSWRECVEDAGRCVVEKDPSEILGGIYLVWWRLRKAWM